jgi:predicted phage terminase large subunit-like protein
MQTSGAGGAITGKGANLLIIDDPVKSDMEAFSELSRERMWNWFRSVAYSRLEPNASIILIMTRWHEDDLAGRIIAHNTTGNGMESTTQDDDLSESWEQITFPAIAETCDILGRKPGQSLWPERYPKRRMSKIQYVMGEYWWNAMYQQRPTPEAGGIFKKAWWKVYDSLPQKFDKMTMSWDLAFKDNEKNDYVVGQAWGQIGSSFYLVDQVRGQWSFPQSIKEFLRFCEKWPQAKRKYVEDKANGPALMATLKRKIRGLIPVEPLGGKVARAHNITWVMEAGNVYIPSKYIASWIEAYVDEFTAFPNAAHDDQVDATTQALCQIANKGGSVVSAGKNMIIDDFLNEGGELLNGTDFNY